jgi:hypothetical protein
VAFRATCSCGLTEATAFTATVATHEPRFARERTNEAARDSSVASPRNPGFAITHEDCRAGQGTATGVQGQVDDEVRPEKKLRRVVYHGNGKEKAGWI